MDYAARNGQVRSLSTFLGDDGWQDLVRAGDEEWVQHVLEGATRVGCMRPPGMAT